MNIVRSDLQKYVGYYSAELHEFDDEEDMSVILTISAVPKDLAEWDPAKVVDEYGTYDDLTLLSEDIVAYSRKIASEKEIDRSWLVNGADFSVSDVRNSLRHMRDFFSRYAHRFALHYEHPIGKWHEFYFDNSDKVYRIMAGQGDCYALPEPFTRGCGPVIDMREGRGPRVAHAAVRDPETNKHTRGEEVPIEIHVQSLWERAHGDDYLRLTERVSDDAHKLHVRKT